MTTKLSNNLKSLIMEYFYLNEMLLLRSINQELKKTISKIKTFSEFVKLLNFKITQKVAFGVGIEFHQLKEELSMNTDKVSTVLGSYFHICFPFEKKLMLNYKLNEVGLENLYHFLLFDLCQVESIHIREKINTGLIFPLSNIISKCSKIKSLTLSSNGFTIISAVLNNIILNPSIIKINFSWNNIGNDLRYEKVFRDFIKESKFLKKLNLSYNCINSDFVKQISKSLKLHQNGKEYMLESLNLNFNNIELQGVKSLVKALKINKVLKDLNLSSNCFCLESIQVICDLITCTKTLTSLSLCSNSIDDEATKFVMQALKNNTSLICLNLAENSISNGIPIGTFLQENKQLSFLNLSENKINLENALHILNAASINKKLIKIDLFNNLFIPGKENLANFYMFGYDFLNLRMPS
jgi:hypothetical protein